MNITFSTERMAGKDISFLRTNSYQSLRSTINLNQDTVTFTSNKKIKREIIYSEKDLIKARIIAGFLRLENPQTATPQSNAEAKRAITQKVLLERLGIDIEKNPICKAVALGRNLWESFLYSLNVNPVTIHEIIKACHISTELKKPFNELNAGDFWNLPTTYDDELYKRHLEKAFEICREIHSKFVGSANKILSPDEIEQAKKMIKRTIRRAINCKTI